MTALDRMVAGMVKPLEFHSLGDSRYRDGWNPNEWFSRGSAVSYRIKRLTGARMVRCGLAGKFRVSIAGQYHSFGGDFDTFADAVAAAQADYTARNLAAVPMLADVVSALLDIADPKRLASHGDPTVLRDHARAIIAKLEPKP